MQLTRREVYIILGDNIFCPASEAIKKIENLVSERFACSYTLPDDMKKICRNLFYSFRRKWRQVKTRKYFFTKYEKWLNVPLTFYKPPVVSETSRSEHCNTVPNTTDSSNSCKRRRIEDIPSCSYSTELSSVPQTSDIVLESSRENENRLPQTRNIILESSRENENRRRFKDLTTVSDDYALSLLLEIKLLKHQYEVLRATNIENNCNIYPPYKAVLQAKEKCYPPKTDIKIKDCSAEVKLQGLLDHSVEQILFIQRDFLKSSTSECISNMTLYCKWGFWDLGHCTS
ncbi:dna-mediated transposase [Vespula maculifrons]|uniref:Dna-mediated transposase n=1 Tax=Vespula maculifrons TaxID=7453 RepID=A0ABD2CYS4_VESMC